MKISKLKRLLKSVDDDKEVYVYSDSDHLIANIEPRFVIKYSVRNGNNEAIYDSQNEALANCKADDVFAKIVCFEIDVPH